jgi:hypothetical protein
MIVSIGGVDYNVRLTVCSNERVMRLEGNAAALRAWLIGVDNWLWENHKTVADRHSNGADWRALQYMGGLGADYIAVAVYDSGGIKLHSVPTEVGCYTINLAHDAQIAGADALHAFLNG